MLSMKKIPPQEVVDQCTHLSPSNQSQLLQLLSGFSGLFSSTLERYVHRKFSIQLKDPSTPLTFCTTYAIPLVHQRVFRQELNHIIDKKVLRRISNSELAFPTFLIPKKNGRKCLIQGLRNKTNRHWDCKFPPSPNLHINQLNVVSYFRYGLLIIK